MGQESEEEEEEEEEERHGRGPSHHPPAPSDELFDISTTVDPSYVIALIRKLLPKNVAVRPSSDIDNQGSNISATGDDKTASSSDNGAMFSLQNANEVHGMDLTDGFSHGEIAGGEQTGRDLSVGEGDWEEHGCVLWDLAANTTHAELMVENLLLEVLAANLGVQQSVRAREISLGIIGNLACHETLMRRVVSTNGLTELIIDQLFLDDAQCLCEACRLLSSGLRSSESLAWAAALQSENVLSRVLWIVENSLNPQLIEKSVELLLAIVEGSDDVVRVVLPPLMKMGLPNILINLLAYEINNLTTERGRERLPILDAILRAIEALSVIDGDSQDISSNKELFQLVCKLVKLPDKAEVGNSCITAAVLIANILYDVADLASDLSSDVTFLQGLLDIFPLASGDLEARSAPWNVMARLLVHVRESEMSLTALNHYVSVLTSKSDLIEDDLLDDPFEDAIKSRPRKTALTKMINILNQWNALNGDAKNTNVGVSRLLDCCLRHIEAGYCEITT